jgi:hypothetical protein
VATYLSDIMSILTENQKVASLEPSKKSDEGAAQKEIVAIWKRETLPTNTGAKRVDGNCTPSRRFDKMVTQNKTQADERETLLTKTGAKQVDGDRTPSRRSDKGVNQKVTQANQAEASPAKTGVKQADGTCASCSTRTSTGGVTGAKQNHIYEENQPSPTKSCGTNHEKEHGKGTGRNANDASTSHANNKNVEMNNRIGHVPVHHFMDRNPTARAFEVCNLYFSGTILNVEWFCLVLVGLIADLLLVFAFKIDLSAY